jgi:phosphotransferase system enzyme I (PtsI)
VSKRERKDEERTWRGLGVSEGVAVGRVLRLHASARYIFRAPLDETEVANEIRRLRTAVRFARRQILSIKRRAERKLGADHAYIFDAHLLMLEDRRLLGDIETVVRDERVNAEWAIKVVTDRLIEAYAAIKDDYLRARHTDIEDVTRRLLVALGDAAEKEASKKRRREVSNLEENRAAPRLHSMPDSIIVAEELLPSAAAELDFTNVRAIVTDIGGWTSHTAIIARAMGVPSVVGLRDFYRQARTGDAAIVDARKGLVLLHPSAETRARYAEFANGSARAARTSEVSDETPPQTLTRDGVEIFLRANVELPAEFEGVRRFGARGIGLYRSEFLLMQAANLPSEDEQCATYEKVGRIAGADGAKVRLFDLGGDKLHPLLNQERGMLLDGSFAESGERNPALGLRAIRFGLKRTDILRTQIRAALRAAANAKIELVLPMISDIAEVRRTRAIIEEERAKLTREGRATGALKVGAMIEVPSVVMLAEQLAREVDFFSLGTNDLVQYLLAVDRGNDDVADWFRTLHPAVLRSIKQTLDAGERAAIAVNVCGEMAGTPAYAFILIGLGARDLSMTASSIPRVRQMLAHIEAETARRIAAETLQCATADEAETLVRERLSAHYPNVFTPDKLPAPKTVGA